MPDTPAETEFNTSSNFHPPKGYKAWKIRNDYPTTSDEQPEWLKIDVTKEPRRYCEAVKEYIFKGNVENNFVVQDNKVNVFEQVAPILLTPMQDRDWYHPVWLHYGDNGREPINGLKYAAEIPEKFISENQNRILQGWLCSYFNAPAATVMRKLWADPNNPKWDEKHPVKFPIGSIIFENVFCDVTEKEVYTLAGSPTADACIATTNPDGHPDPKVRRDTADHLRLIQTDFAARDDRFPAVGWVFGTFIYDHTQAKENSGVGDVEFTFNTMLKLKSPG
ncbi:hypothetical protein J3R83DRAFT_1366 [Lanmaoa asiatica]|nr:hypothetical protein J3R83DRAFT_1366 [Lanmaoa asiatica]